jgi:DNA-binding transcriptional MerR regulator
MVSVIGKLHYPYRARKGPSTKAVERGDRVRIAELSQLSGVSVPTIKYYVREGLIPPGQLTSPNQAQYDDLHLRRLRLIRALVDLGGLSIAAAREVLASIDTPGKSLHDTLGKAQYATTPRRNNPAGQHSLTTALQQVDELVARRGWKIKATSPARQLLADAFSALDELKAGDLLALDDYADAAERLANADLDRVLARQDLDSMLVGVVIGNVFGDTILAALRRLAQENASAATSGPVNLT